MSQRPALITIREFASIWYHTDAPTKSQTNIVREMCRAGEIAAYKCGNCWRIDLERTLPGYTTTPSA